MGRNSTRNKTARAMGHNSSPLGSVNDRKLEQSKKSQKQFRQKQMVKQAKKAKRDGVSALKQ